MACKCCQRWAPKTVSAEPGVNRPTLTDPVAPCPGDATLREARDLARLWYQRAQEAGWTKVNPSVIPAEGPSRGSGGDKHRPGTCSGPEFFTCKTCNPEGARSYIHGDTNIPAGAALISSEGHKDWCPGEKLCAICSGWPPEGAALVHCAGKRRHHVIYGTPMHEELLERGCFRCGSFVAVVA